MPGTLDLNLLPVFVAVAEAGSMSAAARHLGTPKSSVSRGIAALEAALGVRLLHRSTRKVSMTTAGASFYERARPLLASLREVAGTLPEQEEEPSGELRVTASVDIGLTFVPGLVARFIARYPKIVVDLRLTNQVVDLVGEGFDVALRISARLSDSSLVVQRLSALELRLFAAPSYVARRGHPRSPADAGSHDWIGWRGVRLPPPLLAAAQPRVLVDDVMLLHRMIREGAGIGVLPTFLAQPDVVAGELVQLLPRWTLGAGSLFFVHPHAGHVPRKVSAFRDFVRAYLRERPLHPTA